MENKTKKQMIEEIQETAFPHKKIGFLNKWTLDEVQKYHRDMRELFPQVEEEQSNSDDECTECGENLDEGCQCDWSEEEEEEGGDE